MFSSFGSFLCRVETPATLAQGTHQFAVFFARRDFHQFNFQPYVGIIIVRNKVIFWSASYSACVVYSKTNSVGESGE